MSEKRFKILVPFQRSRQQVLKDCKTRKSATIDVYDDSIDYFVDLLNNLNDDVEHLEVYCGDLEADVKRFQKENEQLKELIKGNVFGKYREGSLADLEFKAIAYDDIVKLEMSYESEPKLIVICKKGKKENVKSFCQMFIPLGVCYEIKEVS